MHTLYTRINTGLLVFIALTGIVLVTMMATRAYGGPLDPTGAPAPTMKTLQQVEPRTPISQPASAAGFPIQINAPGSYYLTGNIVDLVAGNAIEISANNVTFDLSGFTLTGGSSVGQNGIAVTAGATRNIVVRNGTLVGSGSAIGVFAPAAGRSTFSDLHISGWAKGLYIGTGNAVLRVDSHDNVTAGIEVVNGADFGGSIEDSNFSNNASGILLTGNNTEVRNSVMDINVYGVQVLGSYNQVSESRMTGNLEFGVVIDGNRNVLVRNHLDANGWPITDVGVSNIIGPLQQSLGTNPNANIGWP